jgi:hypothetical protein
MPAMNGPGCPPPVEGDPKTRQIPLVALNSGTADETNALSAASQIGDGVLAFLIERLGHLFTPSLDYLFGAPAVEPT